MAVISGECGQIFLENRDIRDERGERWELRGKIESLVKLRVMLGQKWNFRSQNRKNWELNATEKYVRAKI